MEHVKGVLKREDIESTFLLLVNGFLDVASQKNFFLIISSSSFLFHTFSSTYLFSRSIKDLSWFSQDLLASTFFRFFLLPSCFPFSARNHTRSKGDPWKFRTQSYGKLIFLFLKIFCYVLNNKQNIIYFYFIHSIFLILLLLYILWEKNLL